MADIETTEADTDEAADTAGQAKPAAGRTNDPAIQRLAGHINRLMGPGGDVVDVRAPRSLAAA